MTPCHSLLSLTTLSCLISTVMEIIWFITVWQAISTHRHADSHTRPWNPHGPLDGVYNVFSCSKHFTVDFLQGFKACQTVWSSTWHSVELYWARGAHTSSIQAWTAETRLTLWRDRGYIFFTCPGMRGPGGWFRNTSGCFWTEELTELQ